jgi:hypothetical protein
MRRTSEKTQQRKTEWDRRIGSCNNVNDWKAER